MIDYHLYYHDGRGRPAPKWIALNLVLILFVLGCLGLLAYLVSHPLGAPDRDGAERTGAQAAEPALPEQPPDFAAIEDVSTRKNAFFDYFGPQVDAENRRILERRRELLALRDALENAGELNADATATLTRYRERYKVGDLSDPAEALDVLLRRVDVIPRGMALAQAATESAWGTSRFARDHNNYFGEWCFVPGCGEVPRRRPEGASHELATFDNPRGSLRAYMHNLNTHWAYRPMREIRTGLRQHGERVASLELIKGLLSYSELGQDYVDLLRQIIVGNDLVAPQPKQEVAGTGNDT